MQLLAWHIFLIVLCPSIGLSQKRDTVNIAPKHLLPSTAHVTDNFNSQPRYQLKIKKAQDEIKVDGLLSEDSWKQAEIAKGFWEKFPTGNIAAKRETEVMLTYDNTNLYIAFINYDTSFYTVQTLKRDTDPLKGDGVGVVIDPLNSHTNGFFFYVSPFNVQSEDLLYGDNDGTPGMTWDNKWHSQATHLSDKWIAEFAIPFKTLRFTTGKTVWGINFVRTDLKNNQISTWTKIPLNLSFFDFGYQGSLLWDAAPPKSTTNISFNPYITGGISSNQQANEKPKLNVNAGFEAKVSISSTMNLDLTANPDFSQVEVDRQVTNLTRYNIFFPEKRNFFLENSDLYGNYGTDDVKPFYSRTIGLSKEGQRVPIIAGARLSGSIDNKTRIALMNIQTARKDNFAAQNYTAISASRTYLKRSFVKAYYMGREGFLSEQQNKDNPLDKYGRNAGIETLYLSNDSKWAAWGGYHLSFKSGISEKNKFQYGGMRYVNSNFITTFNFEDVGVNYYADMGFVQRIENYDALRDTIVRVGYHSLFHLIKYSFLPKKGNINVHSLSIVSNFIWNPNGNLNERNNTLSYLINWKNTSAVTINYANYDIRLQFPVSFTQGVPLTAKRYTFSNISVNYTTNSRKAFVWGGGIIAGNFYNADYQQYTVSLKYRATTWGSFGIEFEHNKLNFPDNYGKASLFLISPKTEINFSIKLFWTTFFQYNTQAEYFNINSRLQWHFRPMSDLFLVYTDNYYNTPFMKNKNRSLIFKLNYWF